MKTRFTKINFLLFIFCWLSLYGYGQIWQPVGPDSSGRISAGGATYTSLAIDANGTPYVAYQDWEKSRKATVMKFDGTSWVTIGNAGLSPGQADYTSLAFDANGVPYIAYQDWANSYKVSVMKFNGTNWVNVGTAGFSTGQVYNTSLAFDGTGTPYVAFRDIAFGDNVTVMKFNGTSWVFVGRPAFAAGPGLFPALAVGATGTPYLVYRDVINNDKATVMKFDGTNWVTVGNAGFSVGRANYTSLALDTNDTPYVAYQDHGNGGKTTVMKFDGSSWEPIGTTGFSAANAAYIHLALDKSGIPYVAYKDGDKAEKATIKKFNGNNWETVGTAGISAGEAVYISLAFDTQEKLYIAYRDAGNEGKATVKEFVPLAPPTITTQPVAKIITGGENTGFTVAATSAGSLTYQWQEKRSSGDFVNISNGGVYSGATTPNLILTKVPFAMNGYAYRVQISDGADITSTAVTLTVNVSAFDNNRNWQVASTVGESHFTATSAALALDVNGNPYAAFRDETNNYRATVMKLDGARWVPVGRTGFSAGQILGIRIMLDANGIPYVAYSDETNGNKATVMKFNGTNWVTVGNAGFSAGGASVSSLALDSIGMPIVAYTDGANGNKSTVKKFVNDTWVNVGPAGFSTGGAWEIKLALDASGTPFVVYMDDRGKSTVKEYNGSAWLDVGTTGFLAGEMGSFSLALDANGTPYVAYEDGTNGGKGTVMRYNGNDWVKVGATGFSAEGAQYTSLAVDASGIPFVAYTDWANGGKATVRKYNGSIWEDIGTAGFSAGNAQFISLALDNNSNPFVTFRDFGIAGRVTVMKYASATPGAPTITGAANCGPGAVILNAAGASNGNYHWYTTATGGSAIPSATNATYITPVLTTTTNYYVSLVNGIYESERVPVTATINAVPVAPIVTASLVFCQGSTVAALNATGDNLKWYIAATGGTAVATAPTPNTITIGTTDYYVSQTVNGCESQRAKITVAISPAPIVTLASYMDVCSTVSNLILTGGQPAGGIYSGTGINNGIFDVAKARVGTHSITYSYTDTNGCIFSAVQNITVATCTNGKETEVISNLLLSPNPATEKVRVKATVQEKTDLTVRILSLDGKIVLEKTFPNVEGEFDKVIDLKGIAKGLYLLQNITDKGMVKKRLVVE